MSFRRSMKDDAVILVTKTGGIFGCAAAPVNACSLHERCLKEIPSDKREQPRPYTAKSQRTCKCSDGTISLRMSF
jgi:hypothetical protein